ncbi:molybdopterin-dependent oxidoreductase [Paracoccus sp. S-4012]|uniref:xanthine dehydrogenase family protein molybdopterin-binding subunit n=1 Tax=Paracoccus sp. S-4012 TaxID=2665648 RepID=UPI0012B0AC00|nr:molybdopterin-dependent oxidoreductase [Paracoccus sp. S-4012]
MDSREDTDFFGGTAQGVLSTAMDRPDGPQKVTGTATYADEDHPPGTVFGWLVRATVTRGFVTGLNTDELRAMPGVLLVLRDDRLLRNPAQGQAGRAPVQFKGEVAYKGQPIALVVAESFEQARHAGLAAKADYLDRGGKAVICPEDAEFETPKAKQSSMGDLDAAMTAAAHRLDGEWTTPSMSHVAMEPHSAVAWWEDGKLTVRASQQMLKHNVKELADSLGISPAMVRILAPFVGGGFGSKLGISHESVAAAIAARKLGRPVAVPLHRRQVCETTTRRSESRQRVRLCCDRDGVLTGVGHEVWVSNLPGETFSEPVTQSTPFTYRGENREIAHHVGRLNITCAGSMRAPGEAIGVPVTEAAIDELAEMAGIDPIEFRLRNIPEEDPSKEIPYSSNRLADCLRRGAELFGWSERKPAGTRREGEWLIGMGMATAVRVNMLQESEARVVLLPDGSARVETDMTDIGTGSYSILTQIAAEALGLPADRVTTVLGDSDLPPAAGSGGSFGAASSGSSVTLAAQAVREELAKRMGADPGELTLKDGHAIAGNTRRSLPDLLGGEAIEGKGTIKPGSNARSVRQASWGAQFAEVAVSAVTGEVQVRRMAAVFAAGRVLNPKTARSQCIGGMVFGIGSALTEESHYDRRDGSFVNRDLAEYKIPANLDVPKIEIEFLEDRDAWANPMQAKGIGEVAVCGTAGAILNAIANATGVRFRHLPVTLDKVIAALPRP